MLKNILYIALILGLAQLNADSWTVKAPLSTARHGTTGAVACNSFFVLDGLHGESENECYEPAANVWRHRAHDPTPRTAVACAVVDNKIYVMGGLDCGTTNNMYDPNTDTWTTKAPLPTGRYDLACVALGGKIYALGGVGGLSVMEIYDPQTDTWTAGPSLPHGRTGLGAATLDGKIYAMGGYGCNYNEAYDPATQTWSACAPMPHGRGYMVCVTVGKFIYAIGGYDGGSHYTINEMFDPKSNTWQTKAPMYAARKGPGSAVLRNKIYVAAGSNATYLTECEEYTPDGWEGPVEEGSQAAGERSDFYARVSSNRITLDFKGETGQPIRVVLYDVSGRSVGEWLTTTGRRITLRPSRSGSFARGVYLITVTGAETTVTKKVVCMD